MSTTGNNNNVPKGKSDNSSKTRLAALAGVLALALLASGLIGSQMPSMAAAQTGSSGGERGPEKTVTSMDDIDCSKVKSAVHCVDDYMVAGAEKESSTNAGIPNNSAASSTVSTSGAAVTKVRPDKFSVTVGVGTNGTTAAQAASSNAELVSKVIAALRALGISADQMSTSNYSIYPAYSHKEPANVCRVMEGYPIPPECYVEQQEVTGYRASNSVTVTLDTDGKIDAGKVIDTAIGAGATNVGGAYFFLSAERQEEIRDSLIGGAIASARHRAQVAAGAVGMNVSGIKSISLNDVDFPVFSRGLDAAESAQATPILPGEQQVSITVNVAFYMGDRGGQVTGGSNSFGSTEPAMEFLLSKLPQLGIVIDDELDIHMDRVIHVSESEYHVEFSVQDVNGRVHDGHIEVVDGEVSVATLDGKSIF